METRTLLLVSAVALLVSPAVVIPNSTYNHLHLNLEEMSKQLSALSTNHFAKKIWTEDVSHLAEGNKCGKKFFCKLEEILNEHEKQIKHMEKFLRNLRKYNQHRHANCTLMPQNMTSAPEMIPFFQLSKKVKDCIKKTLYVTNATPTAPKN